jgi:hypothetical protein
MSRVGNWIGELTTTTGFGDITMGGALPGHVAFQDLGNGPVWYVIIDGNNREAGEGTVNGNVLERTTVYATLVNEIYNNTSPTPINLSGEAEVYCTFNAAPFTRFTATSDKVDTMETGATQDQLASEVPYHNGTSGLVAGDVQAAIDEVEGRLDTAEFDISSHVGNPTGAHAASAISFLNAVSGMLAVNVQEALDELDGRVDPLEADTHTHANKAILDATTASYTVEEESKLAGIEPSAKDDQIASEVPYTNTTSGMVAVEVQGAIDELDSRTDALEADTHTHANKAILDATTASYTVEEESKLAGIEPFAKDDQVASEVPFTPVGGVASTDVQAAIAEVDSEKSDKTITISSSDTESLTVSNPTLADNVILNPITNVANGLAKLGPNGILSPTYLPPYGGTFQGGYDASGGTVPADPLTDGDFYLIIVAGSIPVTLDGIDFTNKSVNVNDMIYFDSNIDDGISNPGAGGGWWWVDRSFPVVTAAGTSYDNSTSGLAAINVQDALDEIDGIIDPLVVDSHTHSNKTILDNTTASYTTAEETKLAGIEAGAEVNQSDAEIKTQYENNANTNAFTDAEKSKLGTVEANAKDDQSAAEVPNTPAGTIIATNVQAAINELDSEKAATAYVDSQDTALSNRINPLEADTHTHSNKAVLDATTASYTTTEKTKLGTIETSAKDDQDADEVPYDNTTSGLAAVDVQGAIDELKATACSACGDMQSATYDPTNVNGDAFTMGNMAETASEKIMTSSERTKLSGIETGATADQSASEVPFTPTGGVAATNVQSAIAELDSEKLGVGAKAADSELLDGVNGANYARTDIAELFGSTIQLSNTSAYTYSTNSTEGFQILDNGGKYGRSGSRNSSYFHNSTDATSGFYYYQQIVCASNVTAYASDGRLKDVVDHIDPVKALADVCKWDKVRYRWNSIGQELGGFDGNKVEIGLLADKIEEDYPELTPLAPFDNDGSAGEDVSLSGEDYKTLYYERVVAVQAAAITQLKKELDELKAKVEGK